jgi:hypothetical protein
VKEYIKWMAHNHVAANLLMMLFIVGGLALGKRHGGRRRRQQSDLHSDANRISHPLNRLVHRVNLPK